MVRYAEPSKRSEDSCTQRRKRMSSSREVGPLPKRLSSSQVPLMASHISTVSAVRTARALVRAISKQLRMEEGLAVEKQRKSVTASSFAPARGGANGWAPPGGATRRFPFVGRADIGERQRREALRDLEDACEIFRALHVTREPVEIIGGTREHWAYRNVVVIDPAPPCPLSRRPGWKLTTADLFSSPPRW